MLNKIKVKDDFNKEVEFIINQDSILNVLLKENKDFIPRFSLKDLEIFNDVPVNEPIRPSQEVIVKAIKYGLIYLINYKGEKDKNFAGHERVIYPLVLGRSAKGKILLRAYHLTGWSVSKNTTVSKDWRLFRGDRMLSVTFTGSFYRLAPEGYQPNDKAMIGGIIAKADFDEIRRNQEKLVREHQIQDREDVSIEEEDENKPSIIKVEKTDTDLDINQFMENPIIQQIDDLDNLRVTFLRSVYGNDYIAVIGALGKPNNMVKVKTIETMLGNYKVLDSAIGRDLKNVKKVKGNAIFKLYTFVEKL